MGEAQVLKKITELPQLSADGIFDSMESVFEANGFRKKRTLHRRILIIKDEGAGDFVLFSPVLKVIRSKWPKAHIALLCSISSSELAIYCPYIDEILVNNAGHSGSDQSRELRLSICMAEKLQTKKFDTVISGDIGGKGFNVLTAYLSGASERIAFTGERPDPESKEICSNGLDRLLTKIIPFSDGFFRDAERYRSFAELIAGKPLKEYLPEVWYSEKEENEAQKALAPVSHFSRLCIFCPASSHLSNKLPAGCYAQLAKLIAESEPETGFAVLGDEKEIPEGGIIASALGDRAVMLCGKLSFPASAAVLSRASMYIGNDTGLMHIAAAFHIPVLAAKSFPSDQPFNYASVPVRFAPYNVKSVIVLPDSSIDGCSNPSYEGCERMNECHCISRISAETMLTGYRLLNEMPESSEYPVFINSKGIINR